MVRTIVNILKKVVAEISLFDYEQLNTILNEIENFINSHPLTYMNDENLDKSYNYDLICGKNIATNKVSLLKMTTLSQNTMQNDLQNEYLSSLHEHYTYCTGKTDADCRLYVGDIALFKRRFCSKDKAAQG